MKNSEAINLYFNELKEWAGNSDCDDSLFYALNNGYKLHAVSLWLSTGASNLKIPVKINRAKEMKEIKQLLESCDVFICQDCNHHGFYDKTERYDLGVCGACHSKNIKKDV
jgi:hypothetical protein